MEVLRIIMKHIPIIMKHMRNTETKHLQNKKLFSRSNTFKQYSGHKYKNKICIEHIEFSKILIVNTLTSARMTKILLSGAGRSHFSKT